MKPPAARAPVTARSLVEARREIGCFLDPGLFSNPAYDILLSLLACEDGHGPVALAACIVAAGVPAATALRWIKLLEARGLLCCHPIASDDDPATVNLSEDCRAALRAYLDQVTHTLSG